MTSQFFCGTNLTILQELRRLFVLTVAAASSAIRVVYDDMHQRSQVGVLVSFAIKYQAIYLYTTVQFKMVLLEIWIEFEIANFRAFEGHS